MNLKKYKICAWIGIAIIGIASFVACLAPNATLSNIGSGALIVGLSASIYGFSKWQP